MQHIFEPCVGVNALEFAGSQQGVNHGGSLCTVVAACEKVIFAAQCYGSDLIFDEIIIDFELSVEDIAAQFLPTAQAVFDGSVEFVFWG